MSIFTRAFIKLGGYDQLSARFPGVPDPQGARWDRRAASHPPPS
ncbi:MAG TPA: hypothetical protein VFH61_03745 [Thermoleophilia bacterium]|nr:hypothetical protein [Thermoleophilia bacterium]